MEEAGAPTLRMRKSSAKFELVFMPEYAGVW